MARLRATPVLFSYIILRGDNQNLLFYRVAYIQLFNKLLDTLLGDSCISAGKGFESLVWVRITLAAQYGLDTLCNHCPVSLKVPVKGSLIEDKLAKSFLQ